jgi:PST family polysaccharide transporter
MILFRLFDRSIGIVSTAVLARLLIPADFGLVAMAMSIIAMIELVTSFSFDVALIQMKDPRRSHFDTAWTLNILVAVGGAAFTAAAAIPTAAFYGDPRLVAVMFAIGAAWLITGFESTGIANFRREMNFAMEFRFMSARRVISFVVVIAAALTLRSYWALVIGMAAGRVAGVALSYLMHPYRPRPSLAQARTLFSFSGWILVNNMVTVFFVRAPHFVIGRVFGPQALGAYSVASEVAHLTHTELIAPINRAMFPGYARLVGDSSAFCRTCLDATATIVLIVLPVTFGIATLADPFVRLLLGDQWGEAVPIIKILAFSGAATALLSNNASIYLALGRPHLATATYIARLIVLAVGVGVSYRYWGLVGIAYAELIATVTSLVISVPILLITVKLQAMNYARLLWRPAIASVVMGWSISVLIDARTSYSDVGTAALQLFSGIALGMLIYPLVVGGLWFVAGRPDSIEVKVVRWALGVVRGRRSAAS